MINNIRVANQRARGCAGQGEGRGERVGNCRVEQTLDTPPPIARTHGGTAARIFSAPPKALQTNQLQTNSHEVALTMGGRLNQPRLMHAATASMDLFGDLLGKTLHMRSPHKGARTTAPTCNAPQATIPPNAARPQA